MSRVASNFAAVRGAKGLPGAAPPEVVKTWGCLPLGPGNDGFGNTQTHLVNRTDVARDD
jgi:hypothetical protein